MDKGEPNGRRPTRRPKKPRPRATSVRAREARLRRALKPHGIALRKTRGRDEYRVTQENTAFPPMTLERVERMFGGLLGEVRPGQRFTPISLSGQQHPGVDVDVIRIELTDEEEGT